MACLGTVPGDEGVRAWTRVADHGSEGQDSLST